MEKTILTYNNKNYDIFYVESKCAVLKSIKNNKIWEKKFIPIFKKYISKDSVVIDIGAFLGTHTIILSDIAKKVYAFEPQKLIGKCLQKTITENKLANVELYNIGLSNNKNTIRFFTNNDGGATIHTKRIKYIDNYLIQVDLLDNIINEKIDFIKIDAEGHEFNILEGAKKVITKYKPIIIIEVFKKNRSNLEEWCMYNSYLKEHKRGDDYLLIPI